jgi:hypothetical protein
MWGLFLYLLPSNKSFCYDPKSSFTAENAENAEKNAN